jgi:hypothetical protein
MWPPNQTVGNTEYGLFEQVVDGGRSTASAAASRCLSTGFVASLPNKIKYKFCCLDSDSSTRMEKVHEWKSLMFSLRGWMFMLTLNVQEEINYIFYSKRIVFATWAWI